MNIDCEAEGSYKQTFQNVKSNWIHSQETVLPAIIIAIGQYKTYKTYVLHIQLLISTYPNPNDAINSFEMQFKVTRLYLLLLVLSVPDRCECILKCIEKCDWLTKQMSLLTKAEMEMP